jgi:HK97 family phage portal protein
MRWPAFLRFGRKSRDSLDLFREIYGGKLSKAGQTVNWQTAIQCAAAMACARVIANGIAQVPLKLFQEDPKGGRLPARDHSLYRVLHRKPNQWQTSFEFRETIGLHLVFAGRAYAYKVRVAGDLRELVPFEPNKVEAKLAADGSGRVVYQVTGNDGQVREFGQDDIWHLKGPSWCGWQGLDAMAMAREAIGLALATEAAHSNLHSNAVRPSGVYSFEGTLSPEQHKQLRAFLKDNYAGENSGLPMVVDRGAKWLSTAMSGVDAQHLETRRFQVEEVCRAMGVMPIMVFQSDKAATYASAEAMFQAHAVHTMATWWERIEQSIDCNLLTDADERAGIYAKFVSNALLRGSMKDRADYYAKALGAGGSPAWMSQDEVRGLEELNPMGGAAALLPKPTNVPKPPSKDDDQEPEGTTP